MSGVTTTVAFIMIISLCSATGGIGSTAAQSSELPNTITIEGSSNYKLIVSGDLEKNRECTIEDTDTVESLSATGNGTIVTGAVWDGCDSYYFSGEIVHLEMKGSGTVYFNDQEIDPEMYTTEPADALAAKEEAQQRAQELRTLESRTHANIDDGVLTAVERDIDQGNASFQNQDYAQAWISYQAAKEKASPALIRGYRDGAATLLDVTDAYLAKLNELGYISPQFHEFEQRVEQQREELQATDDPDLATARQQYENALALRQEAETELPPPWRIRITNALINGGPILAILLALGVVGGVWWRWRRSTDEDRLDKLSVRE